MDKRLVRIVTNEAKHTHFVSYVVRAKGRRYHAAQFDSRHTTVEQVKAWVNSQPNLKLWLQGSKVGCVDLLEEQEHNYNQMIGASLKRV